MTILETRFDALLPTLATKEDLADLRAALLAEMAKMGGGLRVEMAGNTAYLSVEMHKISNRQTRWMAGTLIGTFVALVGVAHYV